MIIGPIVASVAAAHQYATDNFGDLVWRNAYCHARMCMAPGPFDIADRAMLAEQRDAAIMRSLATCSVNRSTRLLLAAWEGFTMQELASTPGFVDGDPVRSYTYLEYILGLHTIGS